MCADPMMTVTRIHRQAEVCWGDLLSVMGLFLILCTLVSATVQKVIQYKCLSKLGILSYCEELIWPFLMFIRSERSAQTFSPSGRLTKNGRDWGIVLLARKMRALKSLTTLTINCEASCCIKR